MFLQLMNLFIYTQFSSFILPIIYNLAHYIDKEAGQVIDNFVHNNIYTQTELLFVNFFFWEHNVGLKVVKKKTKHKNIQLQKYIRQQVSK